MKTIYLVSDQKGMIQAYPTFKEGKDKFDLMCTNHIKTLSDNPTFNYKRYKIEDGLFQFRSYYKSNVKGKIRYFNDIFTFQSIIID